jgi:hypothetical protein
MGMNVRRLMGRFDLEGQCVGARRFGNGHLQDTRLVTMRTEEGDKEIVLQGINTRIFPRVRKLMENMVRATDHLRQALEARPPTGRREVLQLIKSKDGKPWVRDHLGGWWRATYRIQNASSVDIPSDPSQVLAAARAFGELLRLLSDLRPHHLHEVIMRFHDLQARLATFEAVLSADPKNRASNARAEIIFVRSRTGMVKQLPSLRAPAGLPVRVTHNDTKLNNVLLDDETGEGVCVLDLDTMMPGLSLYDFGDMIRTMTNPVAEDETALSKVEMDMGLFEKAAAGWLMEAGPVLHETEIKMLPQAAPAMTFMIGVRFLTDYLQGDTYFHVDRPNHNLDRARAQFALVESMDKEVNAMKDVVRSVAEI